MSYRDIKDRFSDASSRVSALQARGVPAERAIEIVEGWEYSELMASRSADD